ncbi:MAG: DNA topoisomerase III [Clostridia bacterium]|nr:DNA topoisomerase III [Clostridia bacterium]NCC42613.1 DNA topoisomerase III [Clostridia bacterium]
MKTLVIAEKPSVGRDIARVLKCDKKTNGFIEGSNYIVTWGLGHLVTLSDPESYDNKYKEWKMDVLPIMPKKMEIEVIRQTGKQYQTVKSQLHRSDVSNIVIATDAGREGELVARWILKKAGNKKPCKRLWISSVTDKAIREGFAHLKDAKEYDNLYHAAVSRAEADWLVGINATRALTCKYNAQLSCGRVQTPTLAMIAKREEEIRSFVPQAYYGISAKAEGVTFTWRDEKSGSFRSFQKEKMEELLNEMKKTPLVIDKVDKKEKKTFPPLLYDLTELQRDANKRFGYSAKETLNIMQRLYENHKVLTYPRTDSRYLTTDVVGTIHERLEACGIGPYRKSAGKLKGLRLDPGKLSFVNNSKVSDHHAIIPTEQYVDLSHMTSEERKIYDLVVRSFISVLYPPCIYEETTLHAKCGGQKLEAKGKVIINEGFREVYDEHNDEEEENGLELRSQILPKFIQGTKLSNVSFSLKEGKTTPPPRFTEATLLSCMENPIKYMESKDSQMAKTLGETGGLGTVATRADIIEKLFNSFLLERRGKEIHMTSKAKQLLELVPEDLKKPELTAQWEMKLSKIAKGNLDDRKFMDEIRSYTVEIIHEIKTEQGTFRHENITNKICPNCGKRLLSVNGKTAKLLVCQDRECGYREAVSRVTNARCPVCHKKMEMVKKGEDSMFVCSCGHKERLSKFQERRKKEGGGVSKKDVASYMKKQQKEAKEPVNNAFADALKGIRLD